MGLDFSSPSRVSAQEAQESNMDNLHGTAATTASSTPRPASFENDSIDPAPTPGARSNPFASPYGSKPASATGSSTGIQQPPHQRYFHSRRIKKGELERPWMEKKDPKEKWVTIIPIIGILVGLGLTGFLIYDGLQSVSNLNYCPVLDDDFSNGFNNKVWTKEVEVGGYGNGQFEWTTDTDENVFIQDGMMQIKPTLQDPKLMETNNVINLLKDGSCSSDIWSNCVAVTNTTNGTVVNPVKSGRVSTKTGASIKYGRVEVEAKLPAGDWLWPAIWMMPVNNTYGPWPASGEIDLMESRGNNYTYPQVVTTLSLRRFTGDLTPTTMHGGRTTSSARLFTRPMPRVSTSTVSSGLPSTSSPSSTPVSCKSPTSTSTSLSGTRPTSLPRTPTALVSSTRGARQAVTALHSTRTSTSSSTSPSAARTAGSRTA